MGGRSGSELVFAQTLEALFHRALKGKLSDAARAELRAAGIDLSAPLLPAYPYDTWVRGLELAARHAFPAMDRSLAFFELGTLMITSYQETLIGRALFAALRVFSAKKIVSRMARNFRTANNYTEVELRDVGPTEVELAFNLVEPTGTFTQAILATGLPAAGVKGVSVEIVRQADERATYRLRWAS